MFSTLVGSINNQRTNGDEFPCTDICLTRMHVFFFFVFFFVLLILVSGTMATMGWCPGSSVVNSEVYMKEIRRVNGKNENCGLESASPLVERPLLHFTTSWQ